MTRKHMLVPAIALVSLLATDPGHAASGDLDTTFGTGGLFVRWLGDAEANAVAVHDGKIVVAGFREDTYSDQDIAVARLNLDGTLDDSFATPHGWLHTNISNHPTVQNDRGNAVAVQDDGKIVVAGCTNWRSSGPSYDFALVRYNDDGSLDNSFRGGTVTNDFGWNRNDEASAVAIQPDGKIVVAGYATDNDNDQVFAVARYLSSGWLDSSFSSDGMVTTAIGGDNDRARAVALQSDGKIVVAGNVWFDGDWQVAVVRYNINGSLDTSFSDDGMVITHVGSDDATAQGVAIQADDKIVVAGYASNGSDDDFALVRYNINGSLDTSFSDDGMAIADFGAAYYDRADAVAIQPDGKIVVAGRGRGPSSTNEDIAVARFNSAGSLDISFSDDGVLTADGFGHDGGHGVTLQSDGKIVVAGYATDNNNHRGFAVARFLDGAGGGEPDVDFGDAPDATGSGFTHSYPVTTVANGARHTATGPTLGPNRDTESDGTHSSNATADDDAGTPDDEDGVVLNAATLIVSTGGTTTGQVDVDLQNADAVSNLLDAWLDFNRDGEWDAAAGEQIFTNYNLGTTSGTQTLEFTIPQDTGDNVDLGKTYARFRLSTTGSPAPTGAADDGEVEDYEVTLIVAVSAPTLSEWGAALLLVALAGLAVRRASRLRAVT